MVSLILLGFCCGILSGMGVGGGTLMVPALIYFWHTSQLTAQGVIIAIFLPTAFIASLRHYRQGYIRPWFSVMLIFGALPAGFFGSYVAHIINKDLLSHIFGIFLIISSCIQFYNTYKTKKIAK